MFLEFLANYENFKNLVIDDEEFHETLSRIRRN